VLGLGASLVSQGIVGLDCCSRLAPMGGLPACVLHHCPLPPLLLQLKKTIVKLEAAREQVCNAGVDTFGRQQYSKFEPALSCL